MNFTNFLQNFEKTLSSAFHEIADIDKFSLDRGVPPSVLAKIMNDVPLAVAIPEISLFPFDW